VRALRELLRNRAAREREGVFVAEGRHLLRAAIEHEAPVLRCYVREGEVIDLPAGLEVRRLARGVAERIGDAVTSQGIFTVVRRVPAGADTLLRSDLSLVAASLADPGNLGTLMRSGAAAGATALGLGPGSVDAYNPKVVRASAGACFTVATLEGVPAVEMLEALGAHGVHRLGAVVAGGRAPESVDLTVPCTFVLGHETRGLDHGLPIDDVVTIPMRSGESLNVAMAATVLLFEAARQRRAA